MKTKPHIRTLKQALAHVRKVGVCLVFADPKSNLANLWDAIDLPEKLPGEKGWGQKVGAVWSWKNQLPADYPDEIFYGKGAKGKSVLMTLDYLKKVHHPAFHRPVVQCSPLAQKIYELVRIEPMTTPALRQAILKGDRSRKAAFAKALVELQVTLNIVRCNAPEITSDTWVRFAEQYLGIG
ncbi:MAG: hypothetical protein K9M98_06070 [Cephaloticoccus sp.]|nr:hypothetical protein [Cephaloticoccus sp.]MCF7760051.1 hypothetical protein [Cephaloticoccus sp.]